jgi:hypothetical protein
VIVSVAEFSPDKIFSEFVVHWSDPGEPFGNSLISETDMMQAILFTAARPSAL